MYTYLLPYTMTLLSIINLTTLLYSYNTYKPKYPYLLIVPYTMGLLFNSALLIQSIKRILL